MELEKLTSCPLCQSTRLRLKFNVQHVLNDPQHSCGLDVGFSTATIVSCQNCRFVFKLERPNAGYLQRYYESTGEDYLKSLAEENNTIRREFLVTRRLLQDSFPEGGAILDVGCASGFFLHTLGEPWRRSGVELSHFAAGQARSRGIVVTERTISRADFAPSSFDVICSFDVVEHLSSPLSFFKDVRKLLRPGGWLVLGTGDCNSLAAVLAGARWSYFYFPEHLSFFNSFCFRNALVRSGFRRFQFKRFHHGQSNSAEAISWLRAIGKHRAIELFGDQITRLGIFRQRTTDFLVPYFWDHIICIAS